MEMSCDCKGIRVWRGFRSEAYYDDTDGFLKALGRVFIPATAQFMSRLGLYAYLPAILPFDDSSYPDEIALVIYPTSETYHKAAGESVIGRAYGMLHGTVFNFAKGSSRNSSSAFPIQWEQSLQAGIPYFHNNSVINWSEEQIHLSVAKFKSGILLKDIEEKLSEWLDCRAAHETTLFLVEEKYFLMWQKADRELQIEDMFVERHLDLFSEVLINKKSKFVDVNPIHTINDEGLVVKQNDYFNVLIR